VHRSRLAAIANLLDRGPLRYPSLVYSVRRRRIVMVIVLITNIVVLRELRAERAEMNGPPQPGTIVVRKQPHSP
jgi:hypothetical protein